MRVVTIEDDTRTLTLAPGDQVELRLPENAGTGYQWQLDPLDPALAVVEEALKPAAGQPGATGEHRFLLRAGGPGRRASRHGWSGRGTPRRWPGGSGWPCRSVSPRPARDRHCAAARAPGRDR